MRMLLGLSETLSSLVEAKFTSARASSNLLLSPTEVAIIRTSSGIPFQLRYCPTLAKKPTPQKEENPAPKRKFDPFENPSAELLVAEIPTASPSHLLVLNKFPIIAEHFILATKINKRQTQSLEKDDLEATYACLKAWEDASSNGKRRLFAFFNGGEHSGASQPHRHLQFLPVENMHEGQQTSSWQLLLDLMLNDPSVESKDGLLQQPALPFTHFAAKFDSEPTGVELLSIYNDLYKAAKGAVDEYRAANPEQLTLHSVEEGDLPISYNLAMTTTGIAILPRRAEGTMLRRSEGTEIGFVALNGTTLGGTMMVKYQEQWDVLRAEPEKLDSILTAIGIPRSMQRLQSRV